MNAFRRGWLALAFMLLTGGTAVAEPALWMVKSASSTVYLFGTVHVLPKDFDWHDPTLDRALGASATLYVELVDDDAATMQPLVLQYGIDLEHPLSSEIDAADVQRIDAAAKTAGLDEQTLEPMRPWMVALTLAVAPIIKAGYDPESGVDKRLRGRMTAAGKPVHGFETAEQQIRFFADMPEDMQVSLLHETLDDYDQATSELGGLIKAWNSGDVDLIARMEGDELREKYPRLYQTLLVQRNVRWSGQIAAMLKQPGTYFVAVGAAHLAGPDSVQMQLGKLGIKAQRLP